MRLLRPCAVALLLCGLTVAAASAQPAPPDDPADYAAQYPAPGDAPDPSEYQQSLAPYGQWTYAANYGQVWAPAVAPGWQPYTEGYWAWSPYGWTWVSYEPWGWTFHYGRWAALPTGWVWVPGRVWGPAWVDWYWGDGYVGWAPLSPFGSHVFVINQFVFVPARDFCSHRIRYVQRNWRLMPDPVIHHWGHRDFRPPPIDRIEHVAREPVHRFPGRPPGTIGPPALDRRPGRDRPGFVTPGDRENRRHDAGGRPEPGRAGDAPRHLGASPPPGWERGNRPVREPGGFVTPPPAPQLGAPRPVPRPTFGGSMGQTIVPAPPPRTAPRVGVPGVAAPGGVRGAPPARGPQGHGGPGGSGAHGGGGRRQGQGGTLGAPGGGMAIGR